MTNFIILAVMIILLMGAATYGLTGAMHHLQTGIENLIVEDRLEEAALAVRDNIVSVTTNSTQTYYVPAPDSLSNPGVPSWITPNAQTPRGIKFLYCPFSNASGAGSSTISTPGSSYTVNTGTTYAGTNISSNNYVIQSSTRPTVYLPNLSTSTSTVLAILVAPAPGESALSSNQDCLSNTLTTTGTLPGAIVRVITEQEVQSRAQVIASTGNEFFAYSSATGDGKGTSSGNFAAFSTVMDYINKYRPQRSKVNFKNTAFTLTVTPAEMDQTLVATREFSSVRNQSIIFTTPWNGSTVSFITGTNGTLSPVVLGSLDYGYISFTATSGQLLRPVAEMFGNISAAMLNTPIGFFAAENTGSVFLNAEWGTDTMVGSPAGSATSNNEMYYADRGGSILTMDPGGVALTGPPAGNENNYLFYDDFGGNTLLVNGTILALSNGIYSTQSPFFVSGGGKSYFANSIISGPIGGVSHLESSLVDVDVGGRANEYLATISGFYNQMVYDQGGTFVFSGSTLSPIAATLPYFLSAGPGATLGMSFSSVLGSISLRPTIATINSNSGTSQNRMATLIGGLAATGGTAPLLYGLNSGSTQCLSDETSYNAGSDASNTSTGNPVSPQGNIGMEAAIILNRTGATCN